MTNGDRVRKSSNSELVKVFSNPRDYCLLIQNGKKAKKCKRSEWVDGLSPCEQCKIKWLESEYEE